MSYFTYFTPILVDFSEFGAEPQRYLLSDIATNVRIKKDLLTNLVYYDEYDIRDNETPEILSEMFYGTSSLHWLVMLANDRYDYLSDFPMDQQTLEQYISQKYTNIYDIHHYESSDGYTVMSDYVNPQGVADATPITNYDYEISVNESKRRIKVIPPEYVGDLLTRFREILKA